MGASDRSGCTAVVTVIGPSFIVCSNAGDSRCVLSRAGKAVPMSVDHKPNQVSARDVVATVPQALLYFLSSNTNLIAGTGTVVKLAAI